MRLKEEGGVRREERGRRMAFLENSNPRIINAIMGSLCYSVTDKDMDPICRQSGHRKSHRVETVSPFNYREGNGTMGQGQGEGEAR